MRIELTEVIRSTADHELSAVSYSDIIVKAKGMRPVTENATA